MIFLCENFVREVPYLEFREQCSLSIDGHREGWFEIAKVMEGGLESL